MRLKVKSS
jgi:geranylgeranyl pyrophosphate synthase